MATQMNPISTTDETNPAAARTAVEHLYAGEALPCPVGCGGTAEIVRVSTLETGAGEIWTECGSCAQRARHPVAPATDEERARIAGAGAADRDPTCPRHVRRVELRRRGPQLFCPACGVRFRD